MEVDLFLELARPPGPDGVPTRISNVYDDLITIAKAADQLGIGAIWLPEHHFLGDYSASAAPDMLLAALARETTSVRLGFAILPLPIGMIQCVSLSGWQLWISCPVAGSCGVSVVG